MYTLNPQIANPEYFLQFYVLVVQK